MLSKHRSEPEAFAALRINVCYADKAGFRCGLAKVCFSGTWKLGRHICEAGCTYVALSPMSGHARVHTSHTFKTGFESYLAF